VSDTIECLVFEVVAALPDLDWSIAEGVEGGGGTKELVLRARLGDVEETFLSDCLAELPDTFLDRETLVLLEVDVALAGSKSLDLRERVTLLVGVTEAGFSMDLWRFDLERERKLCSELRFILL
jgi:hypothetical protein